MQKPRLRPGPNAAIMPRIATPSNLSGGPIPLDELHNIAEESSLSERRADEAERELMEWKKVKFMQDRVGEDFDGLITSVTKFGFFVELTDLFIEGLVPLNTLTDDYYTYHENTRQIIGQRTRKTYSLGQRIRVLVDRIDPVEKKIQFAVLEEKASTKAQAKEELRGSMPIRTDRKILLAGLLSLCLLSPAVAQAQHSLSCQFVSFKVTLNANDNFERELGGGLLFRVRSEKNPGWFVDIVPAEENTKDYIYPVNLPLRFNGNQTLGPGYGETAKSSLSHPHEMNFLLDRSDYDRIFGLVGNVLWSYKTSDPDKALADYTNAVELARKGSINAHFFV